MKPLPFSQTLAHPNDPLSKHLLRVAERALDSIAPTANPDVRLIAFLAGLFHDMGKASYYFQIQRLQKNKKNKLTPHAKSGAVLSWWYSTQMDLPLWMRLSIFLAVLRHHGALSFDSWIRALEHVQYDIEFDDNLVKQLNSMDLAGIRLYLIREIRSAPFPKQLNTLPPLTFEQLQICLLDVPFEIDEAFTALDQAVMFLAGFGSLLAVDKIDAAMQGGHIKRQSLPSQAVEIFKQRQPKFAIDTLLNKYREKIAVEIVQTWQANLDKALFSLTAPTGSGKTLAILNAALLIRAEIEKNQGYSPRIIYCLPLTSVIDQNHAVFRAVLKANGFLSQREREDDLLLKHHHLVDGLYKTDNAEYDVDGAGQLLTETWQSELVVTTFYQLLHSLLSKENANLKRAGQLSGSIVLMDEVQAIPLKYWAALRHLFQAVAQSLGTRFVLLTATRPLIFRPDKEATELLPSHPHYFRALSRVQLHYEDSLTLDEFAQHFIDKYQSDLRSILIIVNQKKAVKFLFDKFKAAFPDRAVMALSTLLTPRERRVRIYLIQRLLRQNKPCLVISTQLVEAGVDLSFPVVHRDFAPLDSVIQSAGRCNRHNDLDAVGEVHLWELHDSQGSPLWQRVYDTPLIEATQEILAQQSLWNECDFLQLSERYFKACWDPSWNRIEQAPVDEWLKEGDFETIQSRFKLILDNYRKQSLFIVGVDVQGELRQSDDKLWNEYRELYDSDDLSHWEKERAFASIRKAFYERVIQVAIDIDNPPDDPITRVEAGEDTYSPETGFITLSKESSICLF